MTQGVSRWELLGLPATVVFGAAYKLGVFGPLGVTAEQLPDLMIVTFFLTALVRATLSRTKKETTDGATKP